MADLIQRKPNRALPGNSSIKLPKWKSRHVALINITSATQGSNGWELGPFHPLLFQQFVHSPCQTIPPPSEGPLPRKPHHVFSPCTPHGGEGRAPHTSIGARYVRLRPPLFAASGQLSSMPIEAAAAARTSVGSGATNTHTRVACYVFRMSPPSEDGWGHARGRGGEC